MFETTLRKTTNPMSRIFLRKYFNAKTEQAISG